MFVEEIRNAIEAAPRVALPEVAALMWRAYGAGQVTEAEAEELSALIEVRKALPAALEPAKRRVGSRPRTDASMERRRRWAAAGRLPPAIAARFTLAEVAVLAVVTAETVKRGDCRWHLDHIAAVAGVSRSTVKAALRQARTLGLLTIEERRSSTWRNLSNVVRIVSREWLSWMRLARRSLGQEGGGKSSPPTEYLDPKRGAVGTNENGGKATGRWGADLTASKSKASRPAEPIFGEGQSHAAYS